MSKIQLTIRAGGSGIRLWPLSRQNFPKQSSKMIGANSLFQKTLLRFKSSKKLSFDNPIIITREDFRFIVKEQPEEMSIEPNSIIIEPSGKDTGPALLPATLTQQKDNNNNFIMSPLDHYITDTNKFHNDIKFGLNKSENGNFLIFGVTPSRIETGYGYLKIEKTKKIKVGQSVYIQLKVKHRLENEHDEIDLMMVEVQTGSYLGEDDIIRYEDKYSRKTF